MYLQEGENYKTSDFQNIRKGVIMGEVRQYCGWGLETSMSLSSGCLSELSHSEKVNEF